MATNFTNKYMQVFQNYNEFGEHSADYVRGEDHIAFLIEENEVIYWLYLEQVWRPLNVRTTTTGQLEDGRTKVAVRLEYVEGGQKYTSVPNIPDPERITSMSHFLEDYPDIEEVNVSGTVNLTDLSYAFAGSKIRDFSMLDTSNVVNIHGFVNNVESIGLPITLNIKTINTDNIIINLRVNELNIYVSEETSNYLILDNCTLVNTNTNIPLRIDSGNYNYINTENNILIKDAGQSAYGTINLVSVTTTKDIEFNINAINNDEQPINIHCDNFILKRTNNTNRSKKYIITKANSININNTYNNAFNFNFGYGIDYKKNNNIILNGIIGNFIFTTPIVDDAFYAKYNHPISIFQYKTTFTEVADVKITEAIDSSLIYVDWGSIDFDTNNMSIEIHNVVNADFNNYSKTFKKLILDNIIEPQEDFNNYPIYDITRYGTLSNDGFISGYFKTIDVHSTYTVYENKLLKNATIYQINDICFFIVNYSSNIFSEERNVKIVGEKNIYIDKLYGNHSNAVYFDIYTLIENNIFNANIIDVSSNVRNIELYFKYYSNIELHLGNRNDFIRFYEYFKNSTIDNPIYVDDDISLITSQSNGLYLPYIDLETIENVYIQCADDAFISSIDGSYINGNANEKPFANTFIGTINLKLSRYKDSFVIVNNNIKHIDINKTKADKYNNSILYYQSCDNETTINLITKLIDNTDNGVPTIYMYRSQANIIGDDNIAAAVAKNYEFAIIEN